MLLYIYHYSNSLRAIISYFLLTHYIFCHCKEKKESFKGNYFSCDPVKLEYSKHKLLANLPFPSGGGGGGDRVLLSRLFVSLFVCHHV